MKFKKIIADFNTANVSLAEELICHVFFSFKLKGVVCDIPLEEPDEGFGTQTLPLPEQNAIIGFLPDMDSSNLTIERIKQKLANLSNLGVQVTTRVETVDEEDWADAWKDYFNVTRITDQIIVKPEWKDHTPAPGEIVIHLDPGMAFGTGTHPTTAMCIALIEAYLEPGQTVLDVGCGSGILMVAAAKLGASQLTGIDIDPLAVKISRENLDKNEIDPNRYHLSAATLDHVPVVPRDMVVANIIAQVIVEITADIKKQLAPQGIAVLSGIIQERKPDILTALKANKLVPVLEKNDGEWVAMAVRHQRK